MGKRDERGTKLAGGFLMRDYLKDMEEFRCPTCNKLFFRYKLKGSLTLEVKCTRCSNISNLVVKK